MKTSKVISIITALLLVVLTVFSLTGCGKSDDASSDSGSAAEKAALYTVNGVDITKATVEMVGDTPNLQIVFSNTTDKDIEVDFSKLTVKLSDGTEIGNLGLTRTIEANTPYSQHAITIEQKYGVELGDKVEIYYGDDLINTVEVTEF